MEVPPGMFDIYIEKNSNKGTRLWRFTISRELYYFLQGASTYGREIKENEQGNTPTTNSKMSTNSTYQSS